MNLFSEHFYKAGVGEESPYFEWGHFYEDTMFWTIPYTRYFVVLCPSEGDAIRFYLIGSEDTNRESYNGLIEKYHFGDENPHFESYFFRLYPEQVIELLGKRYKFLMYNMDLIK